MSLCRLVYVGGGDIGDAWFVLYSTDRRKPHGEELVELHTGVDYEMSGLAIEHVVRTVKARDIYHLIEDAEWRPLP
jgi:hypothetical protein